MQQVKFTDWKQQDTGSNIDWLIDQVIDVGKLESGFDFIRRALSNAVFDFKFGREFDVFRDIGIKERNEPLLIEVVGHAGAAITGFDTAPLLGSKLNIHVAADNGFRG